MHGGILGAIKEPQRNISCQPFVPRDVGIAFGQIVFRSHAIGIFVSTVLHQAARQTLPVLAPYARVAKRVGVGIKGKQQRQRPIGAVQPGLAKAPAEPFVGQSLMVAETFGDCCDQLVHAFAPGA